VEFLIEKRREESVSQRRKDAKEEGKRRNPPQSDPSLLSSLCVLGDFARDLLPFLLFILNLRENRRSRA
jgi:hypothetical protein